jgi:hypothetical protein
MANLLAMERALEAAGVTTATCSLAYGPNDESLCEWDGRPARDGERWCSGACSDAFLDAHVWARARTSALRRAARRCKGAGSPHVGRITVHHDPPVPLEGGYDPGCQHHPEFLHVRCEGHHRFEHRNLRAKAGTQLALFRAA